NPARVTFWRGLPTQSIRPAPLEKSVGGRGRPAHVTEIKSFARSRRAGAHTLSGYVIQRRFHRIANVLTRTTKHLTLPAWTRQLVAAHSRNAKEDVLQRGVKPSPRNPFISEESSHDARQGTRRAHSIARRHYPRDDRRLGNI